MSAAIDPRDLPFPTSDCHGCAFVRVNGNARGSIFLACNEPSLPKYLPQPVRGCARRAPAPPTQT